MLFFRDPPPASLMLSTSSNIASELGEVAGRGDDVVKLFADGDEVRRALSLSIDLLWR